MQSAKKEKILIAIICSLIFLICAAFTAFGDMWNTNKGKTFSDNEQYDETQAHDITFLQIEYITNYIAFKEYTNEKEEYLRKHSNMSEEELAKDKEYSDICYIAEQTEQVFLAAEKRAYEEYGIDNFGENTRMLHKVKSLEQDRAEKARNSVLKWVIPFGVPAISVAVSVFIYRNRRKNERLYREKQEKKSKEKEIA
ncbi:MAG: hypothetical protein NC203_04935 [Firmicutes bacterium]|nr:hypothetical protein [[Eubacterium] siraeum]MCM1487695.1 hypothetical protein [Bacillota bacterium]